MLWDEVVWAGEQGHLCIYLCSLITCARLMEGEDDESAGGDSHSKFKPSKWYYADGEQVPVWFQWVMFGRRWGLVFLLLNRVAHFKFPHQTNTRCTCVKQTANGRDVIYISYILCNNSSACWTVPTLRRQQTWQPLRNLPFHASSLPPILTSTFLPHWEDIWSPTRPALCSSPPLPPSSPLFFQGEGSTQTHGARIQVIRHWLPLWAGALPLSLSLKTNDGHCATCSSTGITISSVRNQRCPI